MNMLKTKKHITALLLLPLLIGGGAILLSSPQQAPDKTTQSSIQGLQTQNKISYKIFDSNTRAPLTGSITPSENGTAQLPSPRSSHRGNIAYDLEITTAPDKTANILIQYDQKTDQYKLSGDGLGNFQEVTYGLGTERRTSKTDWAGMFKDTALQNTAPQQNNTLHFAFNAINVHDGIPTNPSFITIELAVPGGGVGNTPNDPSVGKYTPSGDPLLSVNNRRPGLDDSTKAISTNFVKPLMLMTEQISAVMFQHIMSVGAMMDADIQLDTQRDMHVLQAEAHRDYHPSEQMCVIGTFARSLHNAQSRADFNKAAYGELMMSRFTLEKGSIAAFGKGLDTITRLKTYQENYCDIADNNNGLSSLCETDHKERSNKDIDYARTILDPLTLDVDYAQDALTEEESDILELGKNLYWFHPLTATHNQKAKAHNLMESRRIMAIGNVAQTSLASIIGQKSAAFKSGEGKNSGVFMKNLVEMLLPDYNANNPNTPEPPPTPTDILGENPSYYAMMEMLTKKMYQDGNFYTNLYDKPANVERVKVSLEAIQMMHNRDRYESMLRREMLSSLLLETAIVKERKSTNAQIERLSIK